MNDLIKVMALRGFVHGGREFLPGPVQIPSSAVEMLTKRGLIQAEEAAKVSEESAAPANPLAVLEPLGSDVLAELVKAGFDTPDAIAAAADRELESLPKIGEATVRKIRAALK